MPSLRLPQPLGLLGPAAAASAAAAAAVAGVVLGIATNSIAQKGPPRLISNSNPVVGPTQYHPLWASIALADGAYPPSAVEPRTATAFPEEVGGRRLLGVGLRKTNVLGLKTIDVYSFGVYADSNDVRQLSEKYAKLSIAELKGSEDVISGALENDIQMSVRLHIVYERLSIRSVRSAFEKSIGKRLQKFGGPETRDLLQSFVSLFRDEYRLPKGAVIELSREIGYVLQIRIDEMEIGSIQSKLLCQAILDLYIGEDPLDKRAKESVHLNLANIIRPQK